MPDLNQARSCTSGCCLGNYAYVFTGWGDNSGPNKQYLRTFERLNLSDISNWELINTPPDFTPRTYPSVVAINTNQIAILGGYSGNWKGDVVIYDTSNISFSDAVTTSASGIKFGNIGGNQCASVANDVVVILALCPSKKASLLLEY